MISRRILLIYIFVVCSFSAARADQQWVEVATPHFSVATDGGEKWARDVALRFEHMRTAFGVLFQKISVNTAPLQIIAFRNSKELRRRVFLLVEEPEGSRQLSQERNRGRKPGQP